MQPFAFKSTRIGNMTVADLESDGVQYSVAFETSGVYTLVRAWVNRDQRMQRGDIALYRTTAPPKVETVPPFTWD